MHYSVNRFLKGIPIGGDYLKGFTDVLPIILIVIMIILIINKLKGNQAVPSESEYGTSNDVYLQWKKESFAAKIEIAFALIVYLGFLIIMLWMSFGDKIGLKPIIDFDKLFDFENMNDEEILNFFLNDFATYIRWFLGTIVGCGFIMTLLGTNSFFDLAKWLTKNEVDCYLVLSNESGNKSLTKFVIGNGFLIKERPETRKIFYARIVALLILGFLCVISITNFFKMLIVQSYDAFEIHNIETGEWAKQVFLSPNAIFFYLVLIAAFSVNIVVNKILRDKQNELLNTTALNINQ